MRLLDAASLTLVDFVGENIPRYAILSHTWGRQEVTYQEMLLGAAVVKSKLGYKKILNFAEEALRFGYQWAWVDTCCIDKTSSAELTEAINSMYSWYEQAELCFAYLEDVEFPDGQPINYHVTGPFTTATQHGQLWDDCRKSRWFTRGWTLQELVAPRRIRFYTQSWQSIEIPYHVLSEATGVSVDVFYYGLSDSISVAQKMRWASKRTTTRVEDIAYCLMGLFNVNMPLLYGEGMKAFTRLQEEIIRRSDDETIFLWTDNAGHDSSYRGIFARHPSEFADCKDFVPTRDLPTTPLPFTLTNAGLQMSIRLYPLKIAPLDEHSRQSMPHEATDLFVPVLHCVSSVKEAPSFARCVRSVVLRRLDNVGQRYIRVLAKQTVTMDYGLLVDNLQKPISPPPSDATFHTSLLIQQIYVQHSIRLADLARTIPVSGFRPIANAGDFEIIRTDPCNGLSNWDGDILHPIPGVKPLRGIISVASEVMGQRLQVYLVLGIRSIQNVGKDVVWVIDLNHCPKDAGSIASLPVTHRRYLSESSLLLLQDRLIAQARLTFTHTGLYKQLMQLDSVQYDT